MLRVLLFHALGNQSHDGAEVVNEPSVESSQPMKASNFIEVCKGCYVNLDVVDKDDES